MKDAVRINNINKSYDCKIALNNISLQVREGEIFGLLGPDGSGKTSLIRIINTLILADSGEAFVFDYNVINDYKKIRKIMGYMPGRFSLYQDLSVEENIRFFATIYNTSLEENYHLISSIYSHLEPFRNRRAGKLSGGMKQKLALCCALIHKPKILFLDEPTTGVDPISRKEFWDIILKLKANGITIIVSTPYMDEAMKCDRVALMNNGNILIIDEPDNLRNYHPYKIFSIKTNERIRTIKILRQNSNCYLVYPFGEFLHYIDNEQNIGSENIASYLFNKGLKEFEVSEIRPTIEDTFIYLTFNKKAE